MHKVKVLLVAIVTVPFVQLFVLNEKCYWSNHCPYNYFSTKTYYDAVRGDIRDSNIEGIKACTPVALWSLNRHGTRRAGASNTADMRQISSLKQPILDAHLAGRSRLCSQDVENIRLWNWDAELDDTASDLTESGYKELQTIAERLKEKYPDLLGEYDPDKFYFRPTSEQQTTMSSIAFVIGLFGDNSSAVIDSPRDQDDVIRPYQNCQRWQKEVNNNPQRLIQPNAYYSTKDFKKVAEGIKHLAGIDYDLTSDNVTALFDLCRFEKSWKPETISPWCALFTAHDMVILEYVDDLLHFYRNGYGSELNPKLGKMAVKDLYRVLKHVKTENKSKVVAYFTHDTMMEMVFSAIGLFNDGHDLRANERTPNRQWRTTFISSFAVNLVVSMYRCEGGEHRVVFHVNEKPVQVCAGEWCSWFELEEKFQRFVNADLLFCDI